MWLMFKNTWSYKTHNGVLETYSHKRASLVVDHSASTANLTRQLKPLPPFDGVSCLTTQSGYNGLWKNEECRQSGKQDAETAVIDAIRWRICTRTMENLYEPA